MMLLRRTGQHLASWFRVLLRPINIPPERHAMLWPVRGRIILAVLLSIVIVAGTMMLLDVLLIGQARSLPKWVRHVFEWITWFGLSGWFLWPTGLLLLLIAASPWERLSRFSQGVLAAITVRTGFIFLAIAVPGLFVAIVKRIIGRARPYVWEITDPWSYAPFIWKTSYASFPSGHATTAFAAAVAIGALWPALRLPMWIYAIAIASSRILVNAHFPSDVIGGAIAGAVGALLVRGWFAARGLGFAIGSDKIIHRLPGPSWRRSKEVARGLWA